MAPFYRWERPGTGVASVGAGAVSVDAPVAGMVEAAWAASAGGGVTLVARWHCRVTTDETEWHLRTWSGDFFSSRSWGSAQRESRVWGRRGRVLRRTDWAEDGLAEVQGCTAQIVSLTLFDSCPTRV
jgi:hypothetical protein